eukprot:Em0012g277a
MERQRTSTIEAYQEPLTSTIEYAEEDFGVEDAADSDEFADKDFEDLVKQFRVDEKMSYYPFPSKIFALLYILIHGPHPIVCTDVLLSTGYHYFLYNRVTLIWFILKECGIKVPSLSTVRAFKVPGVDIPQRHSSTDGNPYYSLSLTSIIHNCLQNPEISSCLARFPVRTEGDYTEIYHGKCWNENPRFATPMVSLPHGEGIFVRDWVYFHHNDIDKVTPLEMSQQIVSELNVLETTGIEVYDASACTTALVIAPLILIICDNPRASELLGHLGSTALKYCRICMADKNDSPTIVCEQRNLMQAQMQTLQIELEVKMYGNVCRYFQSFCGRDFKAWSQMAMFILPPYLTEGEKLVLLYYTKVFEMTYCSYFTPSRAAEWNSICDMFVQAVKIHMPEMLQKQKVHLFLHIVPCMLQFGPTSAFCAERCESFNASVRAQNVYGNHKSPSRDIAINFAHLQYMRNITHGTNGDGNSTLFKLPQIQHYINGTSIRELYDREIYRPGTLRFVCRNSQAMQLQNIVVSLHGSEPCHLSTLTPSYELSLDMYNLSDEVIEYRGTVSWAKQIVCCGEYVELDSICQDVKFGVMLVACKPKYRGTAFCLIQAFQPLTTSRGEAVLNDCDCALFELSNKVIAIAATNIRRAVSFVHQCSATCHFEEGPTPVQIEREPMSQTKLHFIHDFSNKMYCYNRVE